MSLHILFSLLVLSVVLVVSQSPCSGTVKLTRYNLLMYIDCITFSGSLTISDPDMTADDLILPTLTRVTGNFSIVGCSVLSFLRAPFLRVVTGDFTIQNNPLLMALPNITSIGGNLKIVSNPSLASLEGLSQTNWTGTVTIESNRKLVSLAPMRVTDIGGTLRLVNMEQFNTLKGIETLPQVEQIYIQNCGLTSLEYLPPLPVYGSLTISNMNFLSNISALSILREVRSVMLRELPLVADLSPLSSLLRVESFLSFYKIGLLQRIEGFNALLGFGSFAAVMCPLLTEIVGFSNVTTLPNSFLIANNPELTQVVGFSEVRRVNMFTISSNPKLSIVTGFTELSHVGPVQIVGNRALTHIEFLAGVVAVNGSLTVTGNNMNNLNGLRNIQTVAWDFVFNNEQTEEVHMVGALTTIGRRLMLAHNPLLKSVGGFVNLSSVGSIEIYDNAMLSDLSGFDGLLISDGIRITDCPVLQEVGAFAHVISLSRLNIERCANLSSLAGFAQLQNVTYDLDLNSLPMLTSVQLPSLRTAAQIYLNHLPISNMNGLKQLQSVEFLTMHFNPNLVEISGLCDMPYLAGFSIRGSTQLCCPSVLRTLSYARSRLSDADYWAYDLRDCTATCDGMSALTCPCSTTMIRCANGGVCSTTPNSFECVCPYGFKGEVCQFAVPNVTSATPSTIDHSGNATIAVSGIRLPEHPVCTFEGIPGRTLYTPSPTPTTVYCVAPPDNRNDSYYANLVVQNEFSTDEMSEPRKLIFYTHLVCTIPIAVLRSGVCQDCPEGGWCSARRVWPRKGYWSESEDTDPVKCRIEKACPGALGEEPGYYPRFYPDGKRVTQVCAVGYTGPVCGRCAENFNLGIYGACIPCLLDAAGVAEVSGTIIFAIILFAVLAVAVATLEEEKMAVFATILMGIQRAMATGQLTATRYGGDVINGLFASLSFFNFDVQFVKPGCSISALDFEGVFWATMAIAALAALFFVTAAFIRSRIVSNEQLEAFGKIEEQERSRTPTTDTRTRSPSQSVERKTSNNPSQRASTADRNIELQGMADFGLPTAEPLYTNDEPPPPPPPPPAHSPASSSFNLRDASFKRKKHVFTRSALFRRRAVHSLIMLGLLIHFQICLRCFQGLVCDERLGPSGEPVYFLRAALDKPCYEGPYLGTMFFIWCLILVFIFGFPIWCFFQVYKVRKQGELKISLAKIQRFGFLYRELKEEFFWFRASAFVVNFFLALFSTTIRVGEVQTFLNALVFLLYMEAIIFLKPFVGARNIVPAVLGILGLLINVISLALEVDTHESFFGSLLFALIMLGLATGSVIHFGLKFKAYRLKSAAEIPLP